MISKKTLIFSLFLFLYFPFSCFAYSSGPVSPSAFSAASGRQLGTVDLSWYDDGTVNHFNLLYGLGPTSYTYGAIDLPHLSNQMNTYTVSGLQPGKEYFFRLINNRDGSPFESGPIVAVAATKYVQKIKSYQSPYLFTVKPGKKSGTVDVTWFDNDTADKYSLIYGDSKTKLAYGAYDLSHKENISNVFTVSSLSPGKNYYFSLIAEKQGKIILWSQPIMARAR